MLAPTGISIAYQDTNIVAINKPSGLLSVPGLSEPDNLFDRVKTQFPNARVIHRLDMHTSGLVLFALHYEAQKAFSQLFEKRKINKTYVAIVNGLVTQTAGEVHSPIMCDWPNRPKQIIDWRNGKPASTAYSVLSRNPQHDSTRIKLEPHTGRTHQLRVHMKQIGHPILGDAFYHLENSDKKMSRLALHAEKLEFIHPLTQEPLSLFNEADF